MRARGLWFAWALLACGCSTRVGPPPTTATASGSGPAANDSVVVYSALDQEFSAPILTDYARATGARIAPKFDAESAKTVGLVTAIFTEAERPICDLFWNNEVLNTIRLKRAGLLEVIHPPSAETYPSAFKDADGTWYGFAARARILIVNKDLVPASERPKGLADLLNPKWHGKVGMAKPEFGTTATHAACLFAAWGPEKAKAFYRDLKKNGVRILSGNKQVAQAVGSGQLAIGLTDTDDALGEIAAESPVVIVYPDRDPDGLGTLFIPNTLAVIKNAPNVQAAERLVEYLLTPGVETKLAQGASGQIPLNPAVTIPLQVETPRTVKPMAADFEAAAAMWDQTLEFLKNEFATSD